MTWQEELRQNIRSVQDLLPLMSLSTEEQRQTSRILEQFPMSVTSYYLSLIDFGDPDDPIRRMALPTIQENDLSGSFDTSNEAGNTVRLGLQHKYPQTVMMLSTNRCAMYCRHCFRKRMVGLSEAETARYLEDMRSYVQGHPEVRNVLVSGGDALLNSNERLDQILSLLVDIGHLDAIRIATRVPVVFPSRISRDADLLALLERHNRRKQLILVTQYNHPRELTAESVAVLRQIQSLGIPIKNQTVLLRGVNDDAETLTDLLRGLVRAGVTPYYVFQCRPVSGVKTQFQVPLERGWEVVRAAKAAQPGLGKGFRYCMSHPSGKIEILGKLGKRMLFQYHEAKDQALLGQIFERKLLPGQTWLEEAAPWQDTPVQNQPA